MRQGNIASGGTLTDTDGFPMACPFKKEPCGFRCALFDSKEDLDVDPINKIATRITIARLSCARHMEWTIVKNERKK
jgi:hypothetical protein